jgi:uncharacterized protein (TIGR00369 family)
MPSARTAHGHDHGLGRLGARICPWFGSRGMLATLADIASAMTLGSTFDPAAEIPVTTDMHIRYFRQPLAGPLTAEANLVHRGRRLLSCECAVTDAENRVLARSTATYMIAPQG